MDQNFSLKPEDGFSKDGYIIDQDCFSSVRYRTMPAHWNGCGWIAAYNLRHALGQEVFWDDVRKEMDEMHTLRIPGPTLMRIMRQYLDRYTPDYQVTVGREAAIAAAQKSFAGIFRYTEGNVPHFISYVRTEDGLFRFFNINDDIDECILPMDQFGKEHFLWGKVISMTVDR